eukprot:sb/3475517/
MLSCQVFAFTPGVPGHIPKRLTPTLFTARLLLRVIGVVLSVSVLAVAVRLRSNQLTVYRSIRSYPPTQIQPVLHSFRDNSAFVLLELFRGHYVISYVITHNTVVLPVGIHVVSHDIAGENDGVLGG